MRILDYTTDVQKLVTRALAVVDRLLPRFEKTEADPAAYLDGASIDLLALLTEVYQLRRFARLGAPHIEGPGGFGTGLDDSDAPTVMSSVEGKENWDFQPWLAEKLQAAEGLIFQVCDICLPRGDQSSLPDWRRGGRYEEASAECRRRLQGVRAYLKAVLDLLDSGELRIQQLIAEDESDNA
jgi:hypothetical protein